VGDYTISVPNAQSVLIVSYTGYETQEVVVGNRSTINVVLGVSSNSLNAIVVTALGIKRESRSLTYSTQSVNAEESSEARGLNLMNSLEGKVAGLSINGSGSGLGADARVILRGDRSISGNSQPLYVIDGVPVIGNPSTINPDNIASINVLKGPNAAALYGSEAQNGVIIIETKKGNADTTQISIRTNNQILSPDIPIDFQNIYAQGISGNYVKESESSWGPKMAGQMVPTWSINPADQGKEIALVPHPNNVRDFFDNGFSSANNLMISTGSNKVQANFSYTRTDASGIVPRNKLARNDFSVRITTKLTKNLSSDTKVGFMQQQIDNPIVEDLATFNPIYKIYMIPRSISTADARNYSFLDPFGVIRQNFWNPGSTLGLNPYFLVNRITDIKSTKRGIFMSSFTYNFLDNLKLMIRGSYEFNDYNEESKTSWDFYSRQPQGRYFITKGVSSLLNADFLFTYSNKISDDLTFDINFGGDSRKKDNNSLTGDTNKGRGGMVVPDFWSVENSLNQEASYNPGPNSTVNSLYAFANIGWKNAIFLDITGRNDWSSTLPVTSRSYFYPSVGVSAVLSDLISNFPKQISFLKLRGSYAKVGNAASPYSLDRFATFGPGGYNGYITLSSTLPNKVLKPEETVSYEAGLDMSLFNNRIGLNITAYKTNTFNQLFTLALPPGSGASSLYTNGGDVQNKGIEILLSGTPVLRAGNFTWTTDLNYSMNRNIVKKINDERPKLVVGTDQSFRDYVVKQGEPFGQVYGIGFLRDENGNVVVGADGVPLDNGTRDRALANANPDWMGGISNTFSYKNISLSFFIDHRQGGTVISVTNAMLSYEGMTKETLVGRESGLIFGKDVFPNFHAVTEDGKPNDIQVDAQTFWRSIGGVGNPLGEAFVQSMTNTRLREVILGYTLPKYLLRNLPISRVNISLVGRNLLFISRASKSLDPDIYAGTGVTSEGQSVFAPPTTRRYGIDIKVDF
jgi:TonB-linked SusC/RagA family outer membrane protein